MTRGDGYGVSMGTRRGDAELQRLASFQDAFAQHHNAVRQYVESQLEDRFFSSHLGREVEDLVQETFVVLWERLRLRRRYNLTWLLHVVDNKMKDRERRERSTQAMLHTLDVQGDAQTQPDTAERVDLHKALRELPARDRYIVVLTYWGGYAAGEVAEKLGISQTAVRKALSRARRKLAMQLLPEAADHDGGVSNPTKGVRP